MHGSKDSSHAGRGPGFTPRHLRVSVPDDDLAPMLEVGQPVIVDRGDQALVCGGIYALRAGDSLTLRLFVPGFAGIGCQLGEQPIGTFAGLGDPLRWQGPVALDRLQPVGRVVEPNADALATLARQQLMLTGLRETTRARLLGSRAGPGPESFGETMEAVTQSLSTTLADKAAADRFALEQRLDAIDARLALLDELIADLPAEGLAEALVKLETLSALQPPGARELEPRLLETALAALRQLASITPTVMAEGHRRRSTTAQGGGCIDGGARL